MTSDQIQKEIDTFCARMSEHTESIRVFITIPQNGMTAALSRGHGNYYAQVGHISEWLDGTKAETAARELGHVVRPSDPPEGEGWKA